MSIRVCCTICGDRAAVTSSKTETAEFKKLYCSCKNPLCGHTFVSLLTFSHTLSPSAKTLPEKIRQQLQECKNHEDAEKLFLPLTTATE